MIWMRTMYSHRRLAHTDQHRHLDYQSRRRETSAGIHEVRYVYICVLTVMARWGLYFLDVTVVVANGTIIIAVIRARVHVLHFQTFLQIFISFSYL